MRLFLSDGEINAFKGAINQPGCGMSSTGIFSVLRPRMVVTADRAPYLSSGRNSWNLGLFSMDQMQRGESTPDPILFRNAIARSAGEEITGHYQDDLQLWVVEEDGQLRPIVEAADDALLATETVTKVRQEAEDQDMDRADLVGSPAGGRAELVTKTEVQQESDDQIDPALDRFVAGNADSPWARPGGRLLELETKTFSEIEQDDDGPVL